jgi:hypothetical protein
MRPEDFLWLADAIGQYFPEELRERGVSLLAELQETLQEAERDKQRAEVRRLSEELWSRKQEGG